MLAQCQERRLPVRDLCRSICTVCMQCVDGVHGKCYRGRRVNDYERTRAREWMLALRGDHPQEALVSDIEAVTGWRITRDRYSRYEHGSTPFGKGVLQHLIDYWASKGQPGPDFTPPEPEPIPLNAADLITAMTNALLAQTQMLSDSHQLVVAARAEAREEREAMAGLIGDLSTQLSEIRALVERQGGSARRVSGAR